MVGLSIIVPVYNTEKYLKRCLDSLVFDKKILNKIDIIIVNDGGTDGSVDIAKEYKSLFPNTIQVIDKENGGHGSTINAGIKKARGKYIKILDSDDWFNVFDFSSFVNNLCHETADIVVTNYKRILLCEEEEKKFEFIEEKNEYRDDMNNIAEMINKPDFFFEFSMPSMAVKTEQLKKIWDEGLLEKTYYVDQQYVAKALLCAETYVIYNLDIYRHFIGRQEQSIGAEGFYKHRMDHERVLKKLLKIYSDVTNKAKKIVLKKQIELMLQTHFDIYASKTMKNKDCKKEISAFKKYLRLNNPEFVLTNRGRGK